MHILYDVLHVHSHHQPQMLHLSGICTTSIEIQTWHDILWCHSFLLVITRVNSPYCTIIFSVSGLVSMDYFKNILLLRICRWYDTSLSVMDISLIERWNEEVYECHLSMKVDKKPWLIKIYPFLDKSY